MKYFVIFLVLIGFTATLFIIPHAFAEQSDPPPVPEPKDDHKSHVDGEPFCGLGAIYQDGICIVDKTGEKFVGSSSDKWEGHAYSLTQLLGDREDLSTTFKDGQFNTIYLSPKGGNGQI